MRWKLHVALLAGLSLSACNQPQQEQNHRPIKVRSAEQNRLHELDAINLAIGLKHAIYDAGYTCKRITDAGFVGAWKNNDMWMAHCVYDKGASRDWAIFAGPDGSAQVRDCADIKASNRQLSAGEAIPDCAIKERPKGSFNEL